MLLFSLLSAFLQFFPLSLFFFSIFYFSSFIFSLFSLPLYIFLCPLISPSFPCYILSLPSSSMFCSFFSACFLTFSLLSFWFSCINFLSFSFFFSSLLISLSFLLHFLFSFLSVLLFFLLFHVSFPPPLFTVFLLLLFPSFLFSSPYLFLSFSPLLFPSSLLWWVCTGQQPNAHPTFPSPSPTGNSEKRG